MAENTIPLFADAGKFYVYVYHDPRKGKKNVPIYVGKGTAAHGRADVHWRERARNPLLASVLGKIRALGLEPRIEIVAWFNDEPEALRYEQSLIDKFKARAEGGTLCNLLISGASGGMTHSAETKNKIREARARQARRPCSPDTARKIAAAQIGKKRGPNPDHSARLTGRKLSHEHRAAIGAGNTGRVFSDEVREKIRLSNLGQKRSAEARENMRLSHLGKTRSDDAKKKTSESLKSTWAKREPDKEALKKKMLGNSCALTGTGVHSAETRRKVSDAVRASWAMRKSRIAQHN